jgi:hypothetical protein
MASFFTRILRKDDLLYAEVEFLNFSLDLTNTARPELIRSTRSDAFVVLRLPSQHVAEQVAIDGNSSPLPIKGFLSCPSRLTFRIPASVTRIAFGIETLLELVRGLELVTSGSVDSSPSSVIEFPDRLLLVPQSSLRLSHRIAPVSSPVRCTELWHTSLHPAPGQLVRFRAIVNPSDVAGTERPIETTLTRQNRNDIVARSSRDMSNPHVVAAAHFTMSALGASAKLRGEWPDDGSTALAAWDHEAEVGRDVTVRTVVRGFLFPFGHQATITTITERQFRSHGAVRAAELAQRKILNVLEPEKNYEDVRDAYPFAGREMPFKRVRIIAAPLTISGEDDPIGVDASMADGAENLIGCAIVVFFVPADDAEALARARQAYPRHSSVSLNNQRVAIAGDNSGHGNTTLNVETLTFDVTPTPGLRTGFLPSMAKAMARIPALQHLLASSSGGGAGAGTTITLHETYLRSGFLDDTKQVFAKFAPLPPLTIPAEIAGGLAAPNFPAMDGLSRVMGPVAGVDRFVRGETISPDELIGETKLLGVIPLKEIVSAAGSGDGEFPLDQTAKLFDSQLIENENVVIARPITTIVNGASGVETRFLWKPRIKAGSLPSPLEADPSGKLELILKGRIIKTIRSGASPPGFEVDGQLKNFRLNLRDLLTVKFRRLAFTSGAARKMEVRVDLAGIEFGGALAFVNKLQKLLESLGQAVTITPQPDGVIVRHSLPIPSAPLGAFSIQNVSLSTSVSLPFIEGRPASVRFALSERHDPFLITVSIFGGTGFLAIEARTDGSLRIEAALEFGGIISLDLIVIKGGVYLLAGIYLAMESGGALVISGHLRLGGYVDVLGLVSVSIEFYIALTYDSRRNVLAGVGRVTVAVKLIFFSESFSFEIRKEIAGFGEGPSRMMVMALDVATTAESRAANERSVMNSAQWTKYCEAFA